jgi:threonine dehydrogenase-like Zn-dependent dehydrogenase
MIGSTMYVPQDFRDVIHLMAEGKIRIEGMITHVAPLSRVNDIYRMIDSRSERFFKIIMRVDE